MELLAQVYPIRLGPNLSLLRLLLSLGTAMAVNTLGNASLGHISWVVFSLHVVCSFLSQHDTGGPPAVLAADLESLRVSLFCGEKLQPLLWAPCYFVADSPREPVAEEQHAEVFYEEHMIPEIVQCTGPTLVPKQRRPSTLRLCRVAH